MLPEKNPYLKFIIIAWAILMPFGVLSIVVGLQMFRSIGGFLILLGVNVIIAWIALIATYSTKSMIHKKIFKDENRIVRWEFTPEDWNKYDGKENGTILISKNGAYINRKMVPWNEHTYSVRNITVENKEYKSQPSRWYIVLEYVLRGRTRRIYHLSHIPIPKDAEDQAREIAEQLSNLIH